jgi:hypothetical protein
MKKRDVWFKSKRVFSCILGLAASLGPAAMIMFPQYVTPIAAGTSAASMIAGTLSGVSKAQEEQDADA